MREAVFRTMHFWLDMGVDGFRLDAIPYLIERDGTSNENLRETHEVIKEIRARLDAKYPGRLLLAEANMWPEDVREYFGDGDECHMAYHFPLMPRMYMAIAQEDRHPVVEILPQTPDIPPNCQWAIFLRNHDELTLEMVTSKERDYMYRMYAADPRARINLGIRRRLAPLMENDRDRIKLMNSLLLSMPGSPMLYYGDEIGMGDNIFLGDRDGVRTPMQWTRDRNGGFSRADPQRLYLPPIMDPIYGYEAVNVEAQAREPSSLLNWTRRLLAVRSSSAGVRPRPLHVPAPRQPQDPRLPARATTTTSILCVANVSRVGAAGRARPARLQGPRAGRDDRPQRVPADRRAAVPADACRRTASTGSASPTDVDATAVAHRAAAGRGPAGARAVRRLEQLLPRARRAVAHRAWRRRRGRSSSASCCRASSAPALVRGEGRAAAARARWATTAELDDGAASKWLLALADADGERPARRATSCRWRSPGRSSDEERTARARAGRDRQGAAAGQRRACSADAFADEAFCRARGATRSARGHARSTADGGTLRFTPDARVRARSVGDAAAAADAAAPADGEQQHGQRCSATGCSSRPTAASAKAVNPELEIGRFLTDVAALRALRAGAGSVEYVDADGSVSDARAAAGATSTNQGDALEPATVDAAGASCSKALRNDGPSRRAQVGGG